MADAAKKLGAARPMRLVPSGSKPRGRNATQRESRKGIKLGRRLINKTAEIRDAARKMIEKGRPPRPVEIVDALAAKGIGVSSGQVCVALRGTEFALKEHIGPKHRPVISFPDLATAIGQVGLDDLLVAREFVQRLGGLEKAMASLVALKQFGGGQATATEQTDAPTAAADGRSPGKERAMRLTS